MAEPKATVADAVATGAITLEPVETRVFDLFKSVVSILHHVLRVRSSHGYLFPASSITVLSVLSRQHPSQLRLAMCL
jgi:hypothetical protein